MIGTSTAFYDANDRAVGKHWQSISADNFASVRFVGFVNATITNAGVTDVARFACEGDAGDIEVRLDSTQRTLVFTNTGERSVGRTQFLIPDSLSAGIELVDPQISAKITGFAEYKVLMSTSGPQARPHPTIRLEGEHVQFEIHGGCAALSAPVQSIEVGAVRSPLVAVGTTGAFTYWAVDSFVASSMAPGHHIPAPPEYLLSNSTDFLGQAL